MMIDEWMGSYMILMKHDHLMSYVNEFDWSNVKCLVYRYYNGVLNVSGSMGLYVHISLVWNRGILDVGS